ncbi:hypothetical protein SAMN03080598_01793 [Algoriphagus boritolerans DSM 17298 = JCM 18970]|uniref:Outer membrane protein beta-barrel domain-containing protein n=2 Tax=Algoriphagus TaxID=246875 RepID=A0A1H5VQ26_9BACT|nr:hypothetical protein SAMN03080598_01793 [Algoriphagus boritolerans DSM 17298 = JCM 18970]
MSCLLVFSFMGIILAQNESESLIDGCSCAIEEVLLENHPLNQWEKTPTMLSRPEFYPVRTFLESSALPAGPSGYTTAIGVRGGYTSGLTLKHFVNNKAAVEIIVGASRWRGTSLTGIYEWHKKNALEVPELSWVYGVGARLGFYDGRDYYDGYGGKCNDPRNPKCPAYWGDRSFAAIGIVGIGGLEYKFRDAPLTIGIDLIPYFYFQHYRGNFIDGSLSLRYVLK